jgi:hypothetical protein
MQARRSRRVAASGIAAGTLVVLAFAMTALAGPAHALEKGFPPWLICANNKEAAEVAARDMPLEPASGATVLAGTPVTFSGESKYSLTFGVASSAALLSSPDIDSGNGSQSGAFYTFTSTKASATPRTIYWTASFTFTPQDCESPSTFTTPVRTLIIAPSGAELAATKKRQEEEATKKKLEEEAAAKKKDEETAAAGRVVLDGVTIHVESNGGSAVKLTCADVSTCAGKLTLTASATVARGKARHAGTEGIGSASFSIAAGAEAMVKVTLGRTGRALLRAAHGHLSATLTIVRTSPLRKRRRHSALAWSSRGRRRCAAGSSGFVRGRLQGW